MKKTSGFTVIEIIVVIAFLIVTGIVLLIQKGDINAAQRDGQRKTAINAMYYNLEEVYYKKNGYYPSAISTTVLTAMDPALISDPNGKQLGTSGTDYRYESTNCTGDRCKSYSLRAHLEKEADYVKKSRNN
jgi:type II secretory pathway pseudopilin PulG